MIKEAYCSYEIAKLLKEKGFPISKYSGIYTNKDNLCLTDVGMMSYLSKEDYIHFEDFFIPTITHQMAMAWLREVHNTDIEVHADVSMLGVKVYTPFISRYKSSTEYPSKLRQYKNGLYFEDDRGIIPGIRHFEIYEEAVEAALKYSFENLI